MRKKIINRSILHAKDPKIHFRARPIALTEIDRELEEPVSFGKIIRLTRKKILLGSLAAIILILIFQSVIIKALLIAAFFAASACSTIWKRKYPELPIGIELYIFGTTAAAFAFGPIFGIFFGIAAAISAEVISGVIGEGIFFSIAAISLVAVAADFLKPLDFVALGIILTLLYDAVTQAMPLLSNPEGRIKSIIFIITHVLFNFIAFKLFAPLVSLL